MKRNWFWIVFGVVHALILLVLFRSGLYHNSSMQNDISVFFNYASNIVGGAWPYHDFTVEYPPVAFVFFTLPRLAASSLDSYQLAFAVEILIVDFCGMVLLYKLARHWQFPPIAVLAAYTVMLLGIGPIIVFRYDLVPAVMVLASLYAFIRGKNKLAWLVLAVAVMTKVYPAVLAPVFLISLLSRRRYRDAAWGVAAMAVTVAVIAVPLLLTSSGGFLNSFGMQIKRGLHAETTYASFLLLGQMLGWTHVSIQGVGPTPLSINAVSTLATTLARYAPAVMFAALGGLYWVFWRRSRKALSRPEASQTDDSARLVTFSFLSILVFMLTNNVLSPQFLIWLLPLVPLLTWRRRYLPWLLFTLIGIVTYYFYPMNYNSFMREDPRAIYLLLSRNLLLIVMAVLTLALEAPAAVPEPRPAFRFSLNPQAMALIVVVAVSSVLFTQVASNFNLIPSELSSGMPGGQPGGGFTGGQPFNNNGNNGNNSNNGFPGSPRGNPPGNGFGAFPANR